MVSIIQKWYSKVGTVSSHSTTNNERKRVLTCMSCNVSLHLLALPEFSIPCPIQVIYIAHSPSEKNPSIMVPEVFKYCKEFSMNPPPAIPGDDIFIGSALERENLKSFDRHKNDRAHAVRVLKSLATLGPGPQIDTEAVEKAMVLQDVRFGYVKALVIRSSHYTVRIKEALESGDEDALHRQLAINYLDYENLLRQVQGLVHKVPKEQGPDRALYIKQNWGLIIAQDIPGIFTMPFGNDRAWRVSDALYYVSDHLIKWRPE